MINVHDKYITYHGDIIHDLSVDLYSTEPPEEAINLASFFVFPFIYMGLQRLKFC